MSKFKRKDSLMKAFEKFSTSLADNKRIKGGYDDGGGTSSDYNNPGYIITRAWTTTGLFIQTTYENGTTVYQNMLGRIWTASMHVE